METKVIEIINSIRRAKGLPAVENVASSTLLRDDLEFSSFDLAELTVKIEDVFDIDIFEDGLVTTVGEIFKKLK